MAYKFQIGDALLGGALRQKGTITGEGIVSASTNLRIGAASISEAELETIDDVTAGTVAANKAVVVDGSKDIKEFRNLQAVRLSASSNIVIGSADINETDLEKIDGITNGNVAANKALVVNATLDLAGAVGSRIRNLTLDGTLSASAITIPQINADRFIGGTFQGTTAVFSTSVSGAAVQVPQAGLAIAGANVTALAGELNFNDGAIAGQGVAGKTVVLDGNRDHAAGASNRIRDLFIDRNFEGGRVTASIGISSSLMTVDQITADRFVGGTFTGTDFDVAAAGNVTLFDTVGASNLTLGASATTVVIPGNLTVQGTRTLLDTTNLAIEDNLIELNRGDSATGTRATNAGAGIRISGSSASGDRDITLLGASDGGRLKVSGSANVGAGFDIVAGGDYAIDGTSVLTSTTLGTNVVNSSLTRVGALAVGSIASGFTQIAVSGVVNISALDIDGGVAQVAALAGADLIIVDDGAGGDNKKATLTQVATFVGNNVAASRYDIKPLNQAGGSPIQLNAETGFYGFQTDHTASFNIDLSGSWGQGDIVIIKSNASGSQFPLTIRGIGSGLTPPTTTIDGEATVTLESAFAAIQLVYDGANWMIM